MPLKFNMKKQQDNQNMQKRRDNKKSLGKHFMEDKMPKQKTPEKIKKKQGKLRERLPGIFSKPLAFCGSLKVLRFVLRVEYGKRWLTRRLTDMRISKSKRTSRKQKNTNNPLRERLPQIFSPNLCFCCFLVFCFLLLKTGYGPKWQVLAD